MYILTSKYFPTDYWPDDYFPALPEGADIQYTEVMEFAVCIATSAGFSVVLPNDAEENGVGSNMLVAGAGTSEVNGTYVQSGINDGKPKYTKDSFTLSWFAAGVWLIYVEPFDYYYRSFDDVATPDLCTTWVAVDGVEPVPTVTAPTVPTLTEVAAFTVEMPMVIEIETYEELTA